MGILDMAEEAAGAFAADKALEATDPNANFLEKAAAAAAGFEGVKMVKDHFDGAGAPPAAAAAAEQTTEQTDESDLGAGIGADTPA